MVKLVAMIFFYIFFFFNLQWKFSFSATNSLTPLCLDDEKRALIQFKNTFTITSVASGYCDFSYPKTNSWKEENDCCSWDGVKCDFLTGQVTGLDLGCSWLRGSLLSNNTLFGLRHLQQLNLGYNMVFYSSISPNFGLLHELTHLNLSNSWVRSSVPFGIVGLSKMISLDLSSDSYNGMVLESETFEGLIRNLSYVEELVFDGLNLSLVDTNLFADVSKSLRLLSLDTCGLRGIFPENVFRLQNLEFLLLAEGDGLVVQLPTTKWSSNLQTLLLSDVIIGELSDSFGNLTFLKTLIITNTNTTGSVPRSIGRLENLETLFISDNRLSGPIPDLSNLSRLETLCLVNNSLNGTIPSWLYLQKSLRLVYLHDNLFTGSINEFWYQSIEQISFSNNMLEGSIPSSIFYLVNLSVLNLSFNNFTGVIELNMPFKQQNLRLLDLSHNKIAMKTNSNYTAPNLDVVYLMSCNLTEFPSLFGASENLSRLDLSDNAIAGPVPIFFYNVSVDSLWYLNLSRNYFTSIEKLPWISLRVLDVHSNTLRGSLPPLPANLGLLFISDNKLTGEIPYFICNASYLEFLDISKNDLSGNVPECIGNFSENLSVLDLGMNRFSGKIPDTFATELITINLNSNQFEGPLSRSLANCKHLEVLDISNNSITDTFPYWLQDLRVLQVLVMRSNRFHGDIDDHNATNNSFPKLQVLDISDNKFSGHLPVKYIENLKSMMITKHEERTGDDSYMGSYFYQDSIFVIMKGQWYELVKIWVTFTAIDLSQNDFKGNIPLVIGNLVSLQGLNISHNKLTGYIPSSVGNLQSLEWLDLSWNELTGEIPHTLKELHFLGNLNLSYNMFVGTIPRGSQLETFDDSSYIGNFELCGFPLVDKCGGEFARTPSTLHVEDDEHLVDSLALAIVSMGYASGFVLGLSLGYIVLWTNKPKWLHKVLT